MSERTPTETAIIDAAAMLARDLAGAEADLVLCFASPHHRDAYALLPQLIADCFPRALLLGCSAGGVIGAGREIEKRPALSLTAASLPGVRLAPLSLAPDGMPATDNIAGWRALVSPGGPEPHFLLLPDPFTCDADHLVTALDQAFPEGRKLGGLASGGRGPGDNALFIGRHTRRDGAVGVALFGNITVDAIVAQGCRPIGQPQIITRCHDNVIEELTGGPPLQLLRKLHDSMPPRDQELFQSSLFIGIEMRDNQIELHQGDFLIRNIIGIEPSLGTLIVGAPLKPYQAVQFHLRDAEASAEDLRLRLAQYCETTAGAKPQGALLFSCLGRGEHLYRTPDHDSGLFAQALGAVPLGGFFCNGEIGPVGGATFLHGYTSSFALFRERH